MIKYKIEKYQKYNRKKIWTYSYEDKEDALYELKVFKKHCKDMSFKLVKVVKKV